MQISDRRNTESGIIAEEHNVRWKKPTTSADHPLALDLLYRRRKQALIRVLPQLLQMQRALLKYRKLKFLARTLKL
ncbi:hypothetical protein N7534_010947 [Penicillium rubens]|nr:hypothetical protein N7534_010947 [Penicillium rubens]